MEFMFDVVLDLANQETAQVGRGATRPLRGGQLMNWRHHHLFSNASGLGGDPEFRKNTGEANGPEAEIQDRRPNGPGRIPAHMSQHGKQQAEEPLTWLMRRQELFGNFGEEVQCDGRRVISENAELRLDQLTVIKVGQFAILPQQVDHSYLREPFETRAELVFRFPGTFCDPPELALIAREKTDDQVGFLERIRTQN